MCGTIDLAARDLALHLVIREVDLGDFEPPILSAGRYSAALGRLTLLRAAAIMTPLMAP